MLQFAGESWLLNPDECGIMAWMDAQCRRPEDVKYWVDLGYFAGGQRWRRAKLTSRPWVTVRIVSIPMRVRRWRELEGRVVDSTTQDEWDERSDCGLCDVSLLNFDDRADQFGFGHHRVRFLRREGFWFTTEVAVLADTADVENLKAGAGVLVTPDGEETFAEDAELWRREASFYAVEDLPFKCAVVEVPANAADPERYARARARELTGLEQHRRCDIWAISDHTQTKSTPIPGAGWHVWLRRMPD